MAYQDIQEFMEVLKETYQLKEILAPVSSHLEITEIADRVSKAHGPALLFRNVKESAYPLLINTFGSLGRMAMALEVEHLDEIGRRIGNLLNPSAYDTLPHKIKSAPNLLSLLSVFPRKTKDGACQEIVEKPDLSKFPVLQCWPKDAGRFITLPLVFTKDPETGVQNVGMYRMQVFDNQTTGMHWHLHKDGREIYEKYQRQGGKMPVSVVIGCDPAMIYAATAPLPPGIDETMFAGFLRRSPVSLTKCLTNDLYIPSGSEFVLEGYVDTSEIRPEGPFGDHTGYYSEQDDYPVFHAVCLTRKRNPVYMATVVGRPPMEDCYLGKATERIFLPLLRLTAPEIIDISFPLEGVFHGCIVVSIDKRYPMQAKKIMHTLWGTGQMMYTKMIVVVDRSVSPHDSSCVMWKVFNNVDWKRDIVLSEGPLDALDHASPNHLWGNRIGIDATVKLESEGHLRPWPSEISMGPDIKMLVSKRWGEYGL